MMPISSRALRPLLSCLLPLLLLAGTASAQTTAAAQSVDRIAAVVNEDVILQSELDRAVANIRTQYVGHESDLPPTSVLERQVLERLILTRLQIARATDSGINVTDEELEHAVQGVAEQNKMTTDQLRERLAKDGLSFTEFRNNVRDEIMTQKLRQSFAQGRINVSEAEVDAAMANASATNSEQYHLAHILVALPDGATPEQIALAQKKIEGVKDLIGRNEMTFAAAAARYSDSQNALEGGDLGWRSMSEVPPAFAAAIQQLQDGQLLGPIRGPSGFQLVQRIASRSQAASNEMATQFSARQILIKADAKTDDAAAKAKADTLAARLTGGADFAKLAAEASDDQTTRRRGGDLGWFNSDTYGTAFGMQVAALSDGQTSAPFKTDAGWVIVQRIGSREIPVGNEAMRSQIRETIGRRKLEEEWNRWLREMRGEAYVDVRADVAPAPTNG